MLGVHALILDSVCDVFEDGKTILKKENLTRNTQAFNVFIGNFNLFY